MAIPSNINLNLGTSYPGTVLDKNSVGTGFTHEVVNASSVGYNAANVTVNTSSGVLEVIPDAGQYNTGATRTLLGVNADTSLSYTAYAKLPLAPFRVYPVTSANINAGVSIFIANSITNILRIHLSIYLVSGTTHGWGLSAQSKVGSTLLTVGSVNNLTSAVANTSNTFVELYFNYNGITQEFSYNYKFETGTLQTVNLGVINSPTLIADVVGVDRKVGMIWRRGVNTGFLSSKFDTDTFALTYNQAEITGTAAARPSTLTGTSKTFYQGQITGTAAAQNSILTGSSNVAASPVTIGGTVASRAATLSSALAVDEPSNFTIPADKSLSLGTTYANTILDKDGLGTGFTHVLPSANHDATKLDVDGVNGLRISPDSGAISTATLKNVLALAVNSTYGFSVKTTINLADMRQYTPTLGSNNTTVLGLTHANADFTTCIRANFEIAQVGAVYKWILKVSGKIPGNTNTFTTVYEVGTLISDTSSSTVELTLKYNKLTNYYSCVYKADNKSAVTISNFRLATSTEQTNLIGESISYVGLINKRSSGGENFSIRFYDFKVIYNAVQFKGTVRALPAYTPSLIAVNPSFINATIASRRATLSAQLNKTFFITLAASVASRSATTPSSTIKQGVRLVGNVPSRSATLSSVLSPGGSVTITGTVASRRATLTTSVISVGKTIGGTLQAQNATATLVFTFSETFKSLSGVASSRSSTLTSALTVKSFFTVGGTVQAQRAAMVNVDNPFTNEYNIKVKSFYYATINAAANRSTLTTLTSDAALKVKSFFTIGGTVQARKPTISGLFAVAPIYLDFTQEADIIIYNQTENAVLFFVENQSGVNVTQASGSIL